MLKKSKVLGVIDHLLSKYDLDDKTCKAGFLRKDFTIGFPGKFWDDATIRLSIKAFIDENSRLPSSRELDSCPYLPSHIIFNQRYQMAAGEWLHEQFPNVTPSPFSQYYWFRHASSKELQDLFVSEFFRVRPTSAVMYNKERNHSLPTWQYVAKRCGVSTWVELKTFCNIEKDVFTRNNFEVIHHIKHITD